MMVESWMLTRFYSRRSSADLISQGSSATPSVRDLRDLTHRCGGHRSRLKKSDGRNRIFPTLALSQLKIQNSLTVKCSIVQSHRYPLKNLALHNSGMILIVLRDGPMSPRACIFTAGGTPNPYSPQ